MCGGFGELKEVSGMVDGVAIVDPYKVAQNAVQWE